MTTRQITHTVRITVSTTSPTAVMIEDPLEAADIFQEILECALLDYLRRTTTTTVEPVLK